MSRVLVAVFSLYFCVALAEPYRPAAQRSIVFDRVGTDEGLSQALATSFVQDSFGYLWIGTQEGLNRYDGISFVHYYHNENDASSIQHDHIWSLLNTGTGNIWVGSDAGLSIYDHSSDSFSRVDLDPTAQQSTPVYSIRASSTDPNAVWVGTGNGLFLVSETQDFYSVESFSKHGVDFGVRFVLPDEAGALWLGSEFNGLYRLDPEDGSIVSWRFDVNGDQLFSDPKIRSLVFDNEGFLWVATFDGGVTRLDIEAQLATTFPVNRDDSWSMASDRVRSMLRDATGDIWIGTDFGLHLWDGESGFYRYEHDLTNPRSLSDNSIHSLYQDEGGVIWAGTFDGISKWNANVVTFPLFKRPTNKSEATLSTNVTSFVEDASSDIWIGTLAGLMKWDSKVGSLTPISAEAIGLDDIRVMSLGVHGPDVWIGTAASGVQVLRSGRIVEVHQFNPARRDTIGANGITSLFEDSKGRMWVTTYGGGVALYKGNGSFQRFPEAPQVGPSFPSLRCMDIVEVSDDEFWVATDGGGIIVINPNNGQSRSIRKSEESLVSDNLLTLLKVEGGVFVGSVDKGLSFFDFDSSTFKNYSKSSGLISDAIYGMLEDDDGKVWISSAKGLTVFNSINESFTSFGTIHGLQSSDFNSGAFAKLSDGSLAFGGINGFNVFFPELINRNEYVPPVIITEFELFNEPMELDVPVSELEVISLAHNDSVFSVSFAAMDFTAPSENQYRYMLEGFDRDWVLHDGGRKVTYTNLDAGSYLFRVQGSNNDGVWNEDGAQLQIIVRSAPWFTWWAYCLYAAAIVFVAYRLFKYNTERMQREAERRYSERLQLYIESLEEASDCILIADSSGVLMYANNTITHGLNKAPSEVIGESMWTVLFEDDEDVESAQKTLENEGRYHGEVQVAGVDGVSVTHDVTIALVQQSTLNEKAYVGISRDVTERKITEAELEAYRKNLEELVEERTQALQKEIAENKAIQVHLADSLQEKELLIKEVHHRVKNNMQVISSLLSIQAQGAGDDVYSNLLNESQQRIKSMALIHETLYQSADLLKIDFQEYIESLTTSLSRSYVVPGVSVLVDVNVENVELDLETAVPCGLVINELVSNSLKHAFKGKEGTGVIDIDFVINQRNYSLRIADNGVGLPENFDLTKNTSMGMEIVSILTTQLEGELEAHNDEGAVFEISFPRVVNG